MPDIRECISRREDAGEDASVSYSGDGIYKVRAWSRRVAAWFVSITRVAVTDRSDSSDPPADRYWTPDVHRRCEISHSRRTRSLFVHYVRCWESSLVVLPVILSIILPMIPPMSGIDRARSMRDSCTEMIWFSLISLVYSHLYYLFIRVHMYKPLLRATWARLGCNDFSFSYSEFFLLAEK